jgi:hypothetical protein
MNGFLKLQSPIVINRLQVDQGQLQIPANYRPRLNDDAVAAQSLCELVFPQRPI